MTFLLWTLGIFLALNITFRLFGRKILTFGMQRIMRKIVKDAEKQAHSYQKNYGEGNFRENVYVDKDVKVSAPKYEGKKDIRVDDIAEEIEYEEI
jgi:hypothetical protein